MVRFTRTLFYSFKTSNIILQATSTSRLEARGYELPADALRDVF